MARLGIILPKVVLLFCFVFCSLRWMYILFLVRDLLKFWTYRKKILVVKKIATIWERDKRKGDNSHFQV